MKKIKTICSAIAALTLLAVAGCDLEVPDSEKVVYIEAEDLTPTALPFYYDDVVYYDTAVKPLGDLITSDTGASISFMYKLSSKRTDNTFEWESPLKIPDADGTDARNVIWIDFGPLGIWLSDAGANFFEGEAKNPTGGDGDWTAFCQTNEPVCMTISFNTDGSIVYYKNGALTLNFTNDTTKKSDAGKDVYVKSGCEQAIKNISEYGFIAHATQTTGKLYTQSFLCIDTAVDETKAKSIYDTMIAKYNKANAD